MKSDSSKKTKVITSSTQISYISLKLNLNIIQYDHECQMNQKHNKKILILEFPPEDEPFCYDFKRGRT